MCFSTVTVSPPQRNDPLALPGVINFHVCYSGTAVQVQARHLHECKSDNQLNAHIHEEFYRNN